MPNNMGNIVKKLKNHCTKDRSEKKETNKISRIFGVKKLLIKSTSISVKFLYILETSFAYNTK